MIRLADVVVAYEYATKSMVAPCDDPDLKDTDSCLVDEVVFQLLQHLVTDAANERRFEAAAAQYLYSGHSAEEMREAIRNDPLLRSLLQEGMAREDRTKWTTYGAVGHDVMLELADLLDD